MCFPSIPVLPSSAHLTPGLLPSFGPLFLYCAPTSCLLPVRAVTQLLSGCCLRMCPGNRHLLFLTSSLNLSTLTLSNSSLLPILSCHLIFITLLRHRFWNTSIFLASLSFISHVSQPYMRTGLTNVLYSLIFVLLDTLLEFHTRVSFTNASLAFPSLALMFSSPPPCLHTVAPR